MRWSETINKLLELTFLSATGATLSGQMTPSGRKLGQHQPGSVCVCVCVSGCVCTENGAMYARVAVDQEERKL